MSALPQALPQPEKAILDVLRESGAPSLTLESLLSRLHDLGYGEDDENKAAIWRLISEQSIQLTAARELRLAAAP